MELEEGLCAPKDCEVDQKPLEKFTDVSLTRDDQWKHTFWETDTTYLEAAHSHAILSITEGRLYTVVPEYHKNQEENISE